MSDAKLKILEDTIRRLKEREEPIKKPSPKWENVFISMSATATFKGKSVPIGTQIGTSKSGIVYPSKDIAETKVNDPRIMRSKLLNKSWAYKGAYPLEE